MPRNGSATSSMLDRSLEAMSTNEASSMCGPMTLPDMTSVISSQASVDGASHSGSPDGPTTDLFGQAVVPASHSAPPGRARRPMTSATCGLRGHLSSPSAALQSSLESRLRRQLDGAGSTLFSLTWRRKATPAGRPYFQLAASARRTSDSDFGSWPTPTREDGRSSGAAGYSTESGRHSGTTLTDAARMASWPTPGAAEGSGEMRPSRAATGRKTGYLAEMAMLASWATPTSRDWKDGATNLENVPVNALLGRQPLLFGPLPSGSPARTERRGQLSPDFSRWLMGYTREHLSCAPTETRSSRRLRPSSSGP